MAQAETAEAQTKPSPLMERLKQRHLDTIATFQATMRQKSATIDEEVFDYLRSCRRKLAMSRTEAEDQIEALKNKIEAHRQLLKENAERLANNPVGNVLVPFTDVLHPQEVSQAQPHDNLIQTRRHRAEKARREVLELGVTLTTNHRKRMHLLDTCAARLVKWEDQRRSSVKQLLEQLLEDLSAIAFVGVTTSQLLVQRAALSVNEQLLANDTTARQLLAQLRQHELLKHREHSKSVVMLYGETLKVFTESISVWSQQLLCSEYFRNPIARVRQLTKTKIAVDQTKKDVANLVEGLGLMIETLSRKQDLSAPPSEVPGGAVDGGWLRFFVTEAEAIPVFPAGPEQLVDQWRVSVDVILRQVQHESSSALDAALRAEDTLAADVAVVIEMMRGDIEDLFNPSEQERQLIEQAAHSQEDLYPYDVVVPNETAGNQFRDVATDAIGPFAEQVSVEGRWFVDALSMQFHFHNTRLMVSLTGAQGGLIPIIHDATAALYQTTAAVATLMRSTFRKHKEIKADYEDDLFRLEEAYQLCEDHLAHAGTITTATDLFEEAMALLKKIEALYCKHHDSRTGMFGPMITDLAATFNNAFERARDDMFVMSVEEVESHNQKLLDQVASLKDKTKGGGKSPTGDKKANKQDAAADKAVEEKILADRIDLRNLPIIKLKNGASFVAFKTVVKYGEAHLRFSGAVQAKPTIAPSPIPKKGKPAKDKGKDKQPAADEAAEGEEHPPELPPLTPHQEAFFSTLREMMSPIFHADCLFAANSVDKVCSKIKEFMLGWLIEYRTDAMKCSEKFCEETKEILDDETNECIRRHYRRPPMLQSQVYEQRVRELQDASQSRGQYFSKLHSRLTSTAASVKQQIDACEEPIAAELQNMARTRTGLPALGSIPALDASHRQYTQMTTKISTDIESRIKRIETTLIDSLEVISNECRVYTKERLRTFEEGGDMSEAEKKQAEEVLAQILARVATMKTEKLREIAEAKMKHKKSVESEAELFQQAHSHNVAELQFFLRLQELFAAGKGKISNQISVSTGNATRLSELLGKLEKLVSTSGSVMRKEVKSLNRLLATDFDSSATQAPSHVPVDDPGWKTSDEALSNLLRSTKVKCEAMIQESSAIELLSCLDEFRREIYARGLYLGCLVFGCEFSMIPKETFLEPKKDLEASDATTTPAQGKKPGPGAAGGDKAAAADAKKDPKAAAKAGGKGAVTVGNAVEEAKAAAEELWFRFLKVPKYDVQVARALTPVREQLIQVTQQYFQQHPPPLLRPEPYGADVPSITETINRRLGVLEQKVQVHVTEATKGYRELVQRSNLMAHRVAQELFVGLANLGTQAVDERCNDIVDVFVSFYLSMARAKKRNGSLLKGSMSAPSNRGALQKLVDAEAARQKSAQDLILSFWGLFLREAQQEAARVAQRAAQALSTMFSMTKSLVSPEHVQPGEDVVVGHHMGLKRLMRQRAREEAARQLEGEGTGGNAANAALGKKDAKGKPDDKKKPDPKKAKGDDKKGKGKGGDQKEEDDGVMHLTPLERPVHEYSGTLLNGVKIFDLWKHSHQDVNLVNHYLLPSQWDAEVPAQDTPEVPEKGAPGKKPAAPAAAAKPGASTKPGAKDVQPAGGSASVDVEPVYSNPTIGPKDRLHQGAWMLRQQLVDHITAVASSVQGKAHDKMEALLGSETEWLKSWAEATGSLRSEKPRKMAPEPEAPPAPTTPPLPPKGKK